MVAYIPSPKDNGFYAYFFIKTGMTGFEPVWDGFQDRCNTVLHHNSKITVFLVYVYEKKWVAGDGFEPPTFGLWPRRATRLLLPCYSWQGGTRTHDKPINSRSLYLLSYMSRICVVNEIYYNSKTLFCPLFFISLMNIFSPVTFCPHVL